MSADARSAHTFYTERIPAQFNRALEEQKARGEAGQMLLRGMQAVNATLRIVVRGAAEQAGEQVFHLNIEAGRMRSETEAAHPPFLTLVHDLAAFEVLEREAGESALGFLGGLAGMAGEIHLTRSRLDNLSALSGALAFTLRGEGGFSLLTHFGPEPLPDQPACSISVDVEAYRALRSGELNPQEAFMGGKIEVEGDMQMAMQLALAVLSPD